LRAEIVATVKEKIQCPDTSELSDYLHRAESLWALSPDAHYPNFKNSIDSQLKNGEFVHQTFIHATAFCLKCKIIVIHESGDQQLFVLGENYRKVNIGYLDEHFQSLIPASKPKTFKKLKLKTNFFDQIQLVLDPNPKIKFSSDNVKRLTMAVLPEKRAADQPVLEQVKIHTLPQKREIEQTHKVTKKLKTTFNQSQSDQKELNVLIKRYVCKYCDHSTNTRPNLNEHEKTHMEFPPQFRCEFENCRYRAIEKGQMKKHQKLKHITFHPELQKDFEAGKFISFHEEGKLRNPNFRPKRQLVCNFEGCNKSFDRNDCFEEHKKTHMKYPPQYRCDYQKCGFSDIRKFWVQIKDAGFV
jgi:hypothetical protein